MWLHGVISLAWLNHLNARRVACCANGGFITLHSTAAPLGPNAVLRQSHSGSVEKKKKKEERLNETPAAHKPGRIISKLLQSFWGGVVGGRWGLCGFHGLPPKAKGGGVSRHRFYSYIY